MNNPFLSNFNGDFYELTNTLFEQVYNLMSMFAKLPSIEDCKKDERFRSLIEETIKVMVIKENPFLTDVKIKNGVIEEVSLKDEVDSYLDCLYSVPDEYMTEEHREIIKKYKNDEICKKANDFFYGKGNVDLTDQLDLGKYGIKY